MISPKNNYQDKYEHLIGKEAALDAARKTETKAQYGMVSAEEKKDRRTVEDIQAELIGAFGPWQGAIYSVCALTIIIHAWQMMANKFLTYPIDHWCERPENYQTMSVEIWLNISSPKLSDGTFENLSMKV